MPINFPSSPAPTNGQTYTYNGSTWVYNGYAWVAASSGSSGSSGTSGVTGSSGTSGFGSAGSSGTSGVGSAGSSGTSGTGSPGTSGSSGTSGLTGDYGGDSLKWNLSAYSTTGTPPSGGLYLNGSAFSNTTQINLSNTNADGASSFTWLSNLFASTNTPKGSIRISRLTSTSDFADYTITTGTATSQGTLTVVHVASSGSISAGTDVIVTFARAGNSGSSGTSGIGGSYTIVSQSSTTYNASQTSGEIIILVDAATAGGTVTINLPTAVGNTAKFTIKKTDLGANSVIVDGSGTEKIDDGITATLVVQYAAISVVSNNANWYII